MPNAVVEADVGASGLEDYSLDMREYQTIRFATPLVLVIRSPRMETERRSPVDYRSIKHRLAKLAS